MNIMNVERRKEIDRAVELIEQAQQILAVAAEEEQDYFDNIPEAFQDGERGERANEAAEALEEVATNMADAMETLEEAKA